MEQGIGFRVSSPLSTAPPPHCSHPPTPATAGRQSWALHCDCQLPALGPRRWKGCGTAQREVWGFPHTSPICHTPQFVTLGNPNQCSPGTLGTPPPLSLPSFQVF